MPKVSRACPLTASIPISPMVRPMVSEMKPRSRETQHRGDGDEGQQHQREVLRRAQETPNRETDGAKKATTSVPIVPATNEPIAAVASA